MSPASSDPRELPDEGDQHTSFPFDTLNLAFDERHRTTAWMTRTLHRLYNIHANRILQERGITIAHWFYLRVLARHGELSQRELSRRVGIASTTAVSALDNLERRGLVYRSRDAADRRKSFVSLTEEGRAIVDELLPDIEEMLQTSTVDLAPEDLRVFWSVLTRIGDNLSSTAEPDTVLD